VVGVFLALQPMVEGRAHMGCPERWAIAVEAETESGSRAALIVCPFWCCPLIERIRRAPKIAQSRKCRRPESSIAAPGREGLPRLRGMPRWRKACPVATQEMQHRRGTRARSSQKFLSFSTAVRKDAFSAQKARGQIPRLAAASLPEEKLR